MRKTKIITTKQKKNIYEQNNKRTDAQSSKKIKKNKTANMRPKKKKGVDHHDSLLVSFVALGTISFLIL